MAEQTTKPARRASVAEKVSGNILGRSKGFKKLVDKIFKACDTTKSGDISKSELYVGTLSVHITLARYAGPAACFQAIPPTREVSDELFEAADSDKSGTINKEEFEKILLILGAQIVSRMVVYYTVLILFVPWFAPKTTDHFDSIPKGGFVESVAHQVISIAIFVLAIPSIWDAIDSTTKGTIHWVNSENKTDSNPKQEADKKDD